MRVLYVATDLREADILQQEVKKAAPKLTFEACSGTPEARTRLDKALTYDAMLLDSSIPEQEQTHLVQHVRAKQIPLPIVALVAQGTTPSSTLVAAVDECVTRGPRLGERLAPGLRLAIERYRVVSTTTRENERLKRSEARLRLIIEALPAGVVLVDQAGKILAMNLAGAGLVGTSGPSDVVGREIYSLADDTGAQQLRDLVTRAFAGERGKVEFQCLGPDGTTKSLMLDALCIQRDASGVGSVLGVLSTPPPAPAAGGDDQGVEFAFGEDAAALADERAALEQALEAMRAETAQLEAQAASERGRIQQVLAELERARATAAEHHAQRASVEDRYREAESRVGELEGRHRESETVLQNLVSRVEVVTEEAAGLRQEKERLAHEVEALRHELLDQRRERLALEERVTGADGERERLTSVLAAAHSTAEERAGQLASELSALQGVLASTKVSEAELRGALEQARAEAAGHAEEVRRETESRARVEAEVARLSAELDATAARLRDELATISGARDEERASLQQRIAELEAGMAGLSATEHALRADLETKAGLGAERDALAERTASLEAERNTLAERAAGLEAERNALLKSVAEIAAERDDLHGHARGAEAARDALHGRAVELEAERERLQGRIRELETAGADLESRRQAAVGRVAELEERRRNEQGALTAAGERANELTRELAAAREETTRIASDRDATGVELTRERETRRALEDEMTVKAAEAGRARAELEQQLAGLNQALQAAQADLEARQRAVAEAHGATAAVEAELAKLRTSFDADLAAMRAVVDQAAQREAVLASELQSLQTERDTRGRQAFDLEATVARERATRSDLATRLEVAEREVADARVRAEQRAAEVERDHNEVVGRLQKLLEQAAAREFQAAALPRTTPAERGGRRRPAERLGQLASAMASDLNGVVGEMAEEARRLLAEVPEGSALRARAEQSLQTATRAGTLVRHLLRMNERESRAVSGVEASALVRTNEPLLRQLAGQDIDLRFDLAAGLPGLECDAEEVVQVLSTLVVTVRGALPLGGTIRVVTQDRGRGEGRRRGDKTVVVSVVAEGYGMVAVPTTVCEEVVSRCGGTFSSLVDPSQSATTLTASLPADKPNESAPGLSQTA